MVLGWFNLPKFSVTESQTYDLRKRTAPTIKLKGLSDLVFAYLRLLQSPSRHAVTGNFQN